MISLTKLRLIEVESLENPADHNDVRSLEENMFRQKMVLNPESTIQIMANHHRLQSPIELSK